MTFSNDNRIIVLKNTILIQYGWTTYNSTVSSVDDMYSGLIVNLLTSYKNSNAYYVNFSCENNNYTAFKLDWKTSSSFNISCRSLAFTYNYGHDSGDEYFTIYSTLNARCLNSTGVGWGLAFEGSNPINWFTIGSK